MAFTLSGRTVQRIAVVGSGNIGPDIALHFGRVLTRHGVSVVVNDVSQAALDSGRERFLKKVRRGGQSGIFRPAEIDALEKNVTFTLDKSLLVGSSLVIESATESLEVKQAIFEELERLLPPTAILASNSSHLEPERIFERLRRPERAMVHHFYFPAERNPLIELVPGPHTAVTDWCLKFYEAIGKVPIRVKSRFGYAVNPIFEGLFLAAMLIQAKNLSAGIIDAIACRVLDLTAGPFTVINMGGGNAQAQVGLTGYHERVMPWFHVPGSLARMVETKGRWRTIDKGDTVSYSDTMYQEVSRMLLGAYFGLACEVLESGIVRIEDLELGVELGLAIKPPFAFMNELGAKKVESLVTGYAASHPGFKVPKEFGPWTIPYVLREDRADVAVLTLRRPKTLNAINRDMFLQLEAHIAAIQKDDKIRGVVITGFGIKSFVAGADIEMLASIKSPEEARQMCLTCNQGLRRIETLGKPVVCAMNGLSLGSGSELAYACSARIARKGLPVLFGQPEVRLGIIPGAGGTQRLPRLIDFNIAWRILRTGGTLSGHEAWDLGLLLEEVEGDVVERAVVLARELKPVPLPEAKVPAVPPEVDLRGLSRKVDEILRKAILGGARLPIDKAIALESSCFGEVYATRDRQIGLDNYLKTRLKLPAVFVHA